MSVAERLEDPPFYGNAGQEDDDSVVRWFDGLTILWFEINKSHEMRERLTIYAPKSVLHSEGRFEACELELELDQ